MKLGLANFAGPGASLRRAQKAALDEH